MNAANPRTDHVVGVDLGGTKIMAGAFNAEMECLGYSRIRTKSQKTPEEVITRIARCVQEAVQEAQLEMKQVKAVGIGAPGPVDRDAARVVFAPNLGWKDLPLKEKLEELLKISVYLENDGNVCALGMPIEIVQIIVPGQHPAVQVAACRTRNAAVMSRIDEIRANLKWGHL